MKQVGLGRGSIQVPVAQSAGAPRFATASSAFNVDALVGRPNISNGGRRTVNYWIWKQSFDLHYVDIVLLLFIFSYLAQLCELFM